MKGDEDWDAGAYFLLTYAARRFHLHWVQNLMATRGRQTEDWPSEAINLDDTV